MPARFLIASMMIGIILSLLTVRAQSQTMYRCGSSYQDKPCANGQQGVVIGNNQARTQNSTDVTEVVDPVCKRRGDEAKKIIWMREGGAQKNDLLAKSSSDEQSQLISDIYAVRGNSNDIRTNIEKNCMQERALRSDLSKRLGVVPDAEMLQALRKAQQAMQTTDKSADKSNGKVTQQDKSTVTSAAENAASDADNVGTKKRLPCPNLKTQLEIVSANLRAGADVATMQSLQQQKRSLEKDIAQACGK
ncbi:hypothetical protein [Undibacterium sp. Ji22W]|uniref:hypothetical protein n=1 Tax=Undibacterium sp. Ji22W TaxID=3413038 RepID=UPI003BF29C38